MKRILLVLAVIVPLAGCASVEKAHFNHKYADIYNGALDNHTNTYIIKEGNFGNIKNNVLTYLSANGYEKMIYSEPDQGFLVFIKDFPISENLTPEEHPCQILLKFTAKGKGKTRIDLVRGSNHALTNKEVDKDIAQIAQIIRLGW
jgi:hypothetical protein